jgi:hypothetical protein
MFRRHVAKSDTLTPVNADVVSQRHRSQLGRYPCWGEREGVRRGKVGGVSQKLSPRLRAAVTAHVTRVHPTYRLPSNTRDVLDAPW